MTDWSQFTPVDQPAKVDWSQFKPIAAPPANPNLPDVSSAAFNTAAGGGFGADMKQALADFFGSAENSKNVAMDRVPGSKVVKDAEGRDIIQLPTGEQFYVKGPGLSGGNVVSAIGTAAEFVPAARAAKAIGAGGGLIKNALLQGAGAGTTEAAKDAATTGAVDPANTAAATLFGGGAELGAPLVGAASRYVKNALTSDASALKAGVELAQQSGIDSSALSHDALIKLGRSASQVAAGADPKALAAQAQYDLALTKGQRMASNAPGKFDQLADEETWRNSAKDPRGEMLRQADAQNAQNVRGAFDNVVSGASGGSTPSSVPAAFENVADSVRSQAGTLKSKVSAAYGAANTKDAWVSGQSLADLQARAVGAVNLVDDKLTPATVSVLKDIGDTSRTGALTLDQLDTLRKRIAASAGASANPTDKANVLKVKSALDSWLDDSMDQALINGDQTALGQLKQARALRAEYGSRFQPNDPGDKGGKLVAQMVQGKKSPDELAQLAIGSQQVAPAAAVSVSRAIKSALGDDQPAMDQYRGALLMKLGQATNGENVGPQQLASNIKTLLRQRPTLVSENYTPQEVSGLGQVANAIDVLLQKSNVKQSSGSAERMMQFITAKANEIPLIGHVIRAATYPAKLLEGANTFAPLTKPVTGYGGVGGALADYSSQ